MLRVDVCLCACVRLYVFARTCLRVCVYSRALVLNQDSKDGLIVIVLFMAEISVCVVCASAYLCAQIEGELC